QQVSIRALRHASCPFPHRPSHRAAGKTEETMHRLLQIGLVPSILVLGACGDNTPRLDDTLRSDLNLASQLTPQATQYVSPQELGGMYGAPMQGAPQFMGYNQYGQPVYGPAPQQPVYPAQPVYQQQPVYQAQPVVYQPAPAPAPAPAPQ